VRVSSQSDSQTCCTLSVPRYRRIAPSCLIRIVHVYEFTEAKRVAI